MRLNRFLARAGLGSRRAVENLITAGRVAVDGVTATDLGRRVDPDHAQVTVDGTLARLPLDFRVFAFHKPRGVVSTLKSQRGQPSLDSYRLRADLPERFVPVGRLDSETTGLLLWTDDGNLNQALCRPRSAVWKTYQVEVDRPPQTEQVRNLTRGRISLDGRPCLPCRLTLQDEATTCHWIMQLHEGRKRQIRRMFQAVGLKVLHLHRVGVGPVELGKLRPGDFRRLSNGDEQELRRLADAAKERDR